MTRFRSPLFVRLAGAGFAGAAWLVPIAPAWADPPRYLDRAVVTAATRRAVARAGLLPEHTRDLASRARTAGLLPTLSFRIMRGIGATAAQTAALPYTDRVASDDSLVIDVRAHFQLDRLLFDRSEVALERIEVARGDRRDAIEREVIEQLAVLARAESTLQTADPDSAEAFEAHLATARAQARLEALTGEPLERILHTR